jgi:hypothetical protein
MTINSFSLSFSSTPYSVLLPPFLIFGRGILIIAFLSVSAPTFALLPVAAPAQPPTFCPPRASRIFRPSAFTSEKGKHNNNNNNNSNNGSSSNSSINSTNPKSPLLYSVSTVRLFRVHLRALYLSHCRMLTPPPTSHVFYWTAINLRISGYSQQTKPRRLNPTAKFFFFFRIIS